MPDIRFGEAGSGKDYMVSVVGLEDELRPTLIGKKLTRGEAAEMYTEEFVRHMEGDWLSGRLRVWDFDGSYEDASYFDVAAEITPYEGDDAEEDEVECLIEITAV